MKHFNKIAVTFLTLAVAAPGRTQVQPHLAVGPFGGQSAPLPQQKIPPELRQFLPSDAILRLITKTQIGSGGETWLLYDNGESSFPEVHLDVIHDGKVEKLFGRSIGGFAGLTPFSIAPVRHALAFAYHIGYDSADTTFVVFTARQGSYQKTFEQATQQRRMKIIEDSTANRDLVG